MPVGGFTNVSRTATIPAGRNLGANYIWAIVDAGNTAGQGTQNELNDKSNVVFTVTAPTNSPPDVYPRNLSVSPASAPTGTMVTISFTITNSGPSATASFTSNVRIAHSSTSVGITDPLLFSVTTIQVAAYGFTNITRTATIPAGRNLGANYIWTIVDVDGNAGQTNEANDISNVVFTVTASTNTPPDVFPRGLTVTPASGPTGTLVTISFTITNSGGTAASSFTSNVRIAHSSTNVTSSDPLLFSVTTMQVAAYGFTNVSRTATIPAGRNTGANYIWTIVDVDGNAGQTNEANDISNVVFTVTASTNTPPDVFPRGLTVTPASGPTGTLVTISFTITNSGGTAASSFTSNVRIAHSSTNVTSSDPLLFSVTTMQVAAYGFTNISRTATIPAGRNTGANYIWTIVDVDRKAGQINEDNDKSNVVFTVTASTNTPPDVFPRGLTVTPASGPTGTLVTISFTITNSGGTAASSFTSNVRIAHSSTNVTSSDPLLFSVTTMQVAAYGFTNVSRTATIPAGRNTGANYIWTIVDVDRKAGQINEDNDKSNVVFTVTASTNTPPDVFPRGLTVTPASGPTGTLVTISFTITNSGGTAASSFTSNVRIAHSSTNVTSSDPLLFSVTTMQVAAYGFTNISRTATIPAGRNTGANYIWTIVDVDGSAGQTNEANDKSNVVFTVTADGSSTPYIYMHPESCIVTSGSSAVFTVGVYGSQPLTYQWRKHGIDIPVNNNATLIINNAQTTDAAEYSVIISDTFGSATSMNAKLTVLGPTSDQAPESKVHISQQPGKTKLVVIVHGYIPPLTPDIMPEWVNHMRTSIVAQAPSEWQIEAYDWSKDAGRPIEHLRAPATEIGAGLGSDIINNTTFQHVHFIAHSAGSALIQAAADAINKRIGVHTTFLDAYKYITHHRRYGLNAHWSDSYYAHDRTINFTNGGLTNTHECEVSWLAPDSIRSIHTVYTRSGAPNEYFTIEYARSNHKWPHQFYLNTVNNVMMGDCSYGRYGYLLSREACERDNRDWDSHITHPPDRSSTLCARSEVVNQYFPDLQWGSPLDLSSIPASFSDWGVHLNQHDFYIGSTADTSLNRQPVQQGQNSSSSTTNNTLWIALGIAISNPVNCISFNTIFSDTAGIEILRVYWDSYHIGSIDSRIHGSGLHAHTFALPDTYTSGTFSLSFELYNLDENQGGALITNIALGFEENDVPIIVDTILNEQYGSPTVILYAPSNYVYELEISTNLIDWSSWALLMPTNEPVLIDTFRTNVSPMYYRARIY